MRIYYAIGPLSVARGTIRRKGRGRFGEPEGRRRGLEASHEIRSRQVLEKYYNEREIGACVVLFTNGSRATDDKKIVAQHCSVPRKYRNVSQGSALHNAQRRVFEKGNGEEILISNYNESREEDGNLREGEENVYPRLVCVL